jgi:hypothetical protein
MDEDSIYSPRQTGDATTSNPIASGVSGFTGFSGFDDPDDWGDDNPFDDEPDDRPPDIETDFGAGGSPFSSMQFESAGGGVAETFEIGFAGMHGDNCMHSRDSTHMCFVSPDCGCAAARVGLPRGFGRQSWH